MLYGDCTVKDGRIEQTNFDTYNSMRIDEMPKVETIIMPSGDFWGGVGEPTIFVAAPAVLNAIFAATGKRIRTLPLQATTALRTSACTRGPAAAPRGLPPAHLQAFQVIFEAPRRPARGVGRARQISIFCRTPSFTLNSIQACVTQSTRPHRSVSAAASPPAAPRGIIGRTLRPLSASTARMTTPNAAPSTPLTSACAHVGLLPVRLSMAGLHLLKRQAASRPTREINREITNICRCGTFQQVREAIYAAANA